MTSPANAKITPMFSQYLGIKDDYPDALLFFRMGDFYELFFEDAEIAARELQIALTCRNPNAEAKVPMCGVPHHAAESYLSQLLDKGYKVAICDQIEDPRQAKGLVKRAVTRVLTPGTVVEEANLSAKEHNYLAALNWDSDKGRGGLAWIDFSTGEWSGIHSAKEPLLWQWLAKIRPRELLIPDSLRVPAQYDDLGFQATRLPGRSHFDPASGERRVVAAQGVASLDVLDLAGKPELTAACGALLAYLSQTQKCDPDHLAPFSPQNVTDFLVIDEVTERNLEIFRTLSGKSGRGTLLQVVDETLTPMGGRLLEVRLRQPFKDGARINAVQECVAWLFEDDGLREELRGLLNDVYDLERLSTRIFLNRASPKDFVALRRSLTVLPAMGELLAENAAGESDLPPQAARILDTWDSLADVCDHLSRALADSPPPVITEGGLFRQGYDEGLDELLELSEHGETKLSELLDHERKSSGLTKLKLGYNKVFGYYFELSKAQAGEIPDHFTRRQTLVNSERFVTPGLKELEEKLLSATERRKSLEYKLFGELREAVAACRPRFMAMASAIARLDYFQGLAHAARRRDWRRPEIDDSLEIEIRSGRHPVVEAVQRDCDFIPNDLKVEPDSRLLIITGPNMAGKSTVLRQAAIITLMAQIGSFVPAARARIGLVDRIFTRVGASDNLAQGRSTFMVEMMEAARILRQATMRSFVILDEIGRGTSTFDGLALAWAMVEELSRRARGSVRTLFATHYHELTALEGKVGGVRNFNIAIREYKGDIIFLRRMVPGPSDKSYGIEVAKLAGVPKRVVDRAREVLSDLEKAREGAGRLADAATTRQSLLPGLLDRAREEAGDAPASHPILDELASLSLEALSPLAALNLLNDWRRRLDEEAP